MVGAALAACGGGGGGSATTPSLVPTLAPIVTATATAPGSSAPSGTSTSGPTAPQSVTFTIVIPKSTTASAAKRRAQYIPPNTGSLTLTLLTVNGVPVTGQSAQGPFNLSPTNNPNCSVLPSSGNTSCTFSISAPVGKDVFVANTFSSNNGSGQSLGSGAIALSVASNATNTASLVLAGPVASVSLLSSATSLFNGNPVPQPSTNTGSLVRAPASSARASRSPQQLSTPTPAPSATPAITSSRVFVIALDAAGNQIINPTTYDITNIVVKLALNGAPAGSVTLTVTYAGLPGEPSGSLSTSTDGGTVGVFAPSDVVSLTLNPSVTSSSSTPTFSPSLTVQYTPQGGTLQTSPTLGYSVMIPPPAPNFSLTETDSSFMVGSTGTVTYGGTNNGTLATSGTISFQAYVPTYGATFSGLTGTNTTFWTCSPFPSTSPYLDCTSTASVTPNGTLPPIVINLVPNGSYSTIYPSAMISGGGAVNTTSVYSQGITVNSIPVLALGVTNQSVLSQGIANAFLLYLDNTGAATTGPTTIVNTLPAGVTYSGYTGSGWSCTGSAPTITCTYAAVIPASTNLPALQLNVTPTAATVTASPVTDSATASTTGATSVTATSSSLTAYGPLSVSPTTLTFTQLGSPQTLAVSEQNFSGTFSYNLTTGSCSSIVSVNPASNAVTAIGGGTCTLYVSDGVGGPSQGVTINSTSLTVTGS